MVISRRAWRQTPHVDSRRFTPAARNRAVFGTDNINPFQMGGINYLRFSRVTQERNERRMTRGKTDFFLIHSNEFFASFGRPTTLEIGNDGLARGRYAAHSITLPRFLRSSAAARSRPDGGFPLMRIASHVLDLSVNSLFVPDFHGGSCPVQWKHSQLPFYGDRRRHIARRFVASLIF